MRPAELSGAALTAVDATRAPWPGEPIDLPDGATFVRRTPGGPAAEPALYIHGLGGSSTNWTDLSALLAPWLDGDAMDLPGFGRSEPARRGGYTLAALSRRAAQLVEHRGRGPVHLIGNSLGGAVAVHLAASRPELIRTLTLVSPAMPDLRPRKGADPLLPLLVVPGAAAIAERRLLRMNPRARAQAVIDLCFADPSLVPENRMAEAEAEVARRNELPYAMDAFVRTLRALIGTYLSPGPGSLWRAAARIQAPTLVIWGNQDRVVDSSLADRVARVIPDSRLLVLEQVGHVAQLEKPETVARAVLGMLTERADEVGTG